MNYKKKNIKVVILAGRRDFGRCPVAESLPTALWPVGGTPVLERLLVSLANQGIDRAVVCSNGEGSLLAESIQVDGRMELEFLDEYLPLGTAGCIRDANKLTDTTKKALLIVLPANMALIQAHRQGKSDLTVILNPPTENHQAEKDTAGIYICEPSILEFIPQEGYFDIKESLIPQMIQAGKTIHLATLPNHAANFRNHREYLFAITKYLQNTENQTHKSYSRNQM